MTDPKPSKGYESKQWRGATVYACTVGKCRYEHSDKAAIEAHVAAAHPTRGDR